MTAKILAGQSADYADSGQNRHAFKGGSDPQLLTVTDIRQQVKRPDRYSVFVDGKYVLSLSANGLLEQKLFIGLKLQPDALPTLKDNAAFDKLYGLSLAYVMRRLRSEWELEQYFRKKEASPELADRVMERLQHYGYVNDLGFARSWIDSRRMLKSVSKRRLQQELRQKRIADSVVQEALAEDETPDSDALRQLVAKKRLQSRYQDSQKLMQYLARQGFNYDDIKAALNEGTSEDAVSW